MKKILIGALMVITSYGAQSQNLIDVDVEQTPTQFETEMVIDTIPQHRAPLFMNPLPPHARVHPPMMRGNFPKPEKIIRKGNKVILIFDRNEFEKFRRWDLLKNKRRLGIGIESPKRVGQPFIRRDYLERNPNGR